MQRAMITDATNGRSSHRSPMGIGSKTPRSTNTSHTHGKILTHPRPRRLTNTFTSRCDNLTFSTRRLMTVTVAVMILSLHVASAMYEESSTRSHDDSSLNSSDNRAMQAELKRQEINVMHIVPRAKKRASWTKFLLKRTFGSFTFYFSLLCITFIVLACLVNTSWLNGNGGHFFGDGNIMNDEGAATLFMRCAVVGSSSLFLMGAIGGFYHQCREFDELRDLHIPFEEGRHECRRGPGTSWINRNYLNLSVIAWSLVVGILAIIAATVFGNHSFTKTFAMVLGAIAASGIFGVIVALPVVEVAFFSQTSNPDLYNFNSPRRVDREEHHKFTGSLEAPSPELDDD